MTQCPICSKGNLSQSGTSVICDNCSFEQFNVSSDYISACATVIAAIASNKTFTTEVRMEQLVQHWMEQHTPYLSDYLQRMVSGGPAFITLFTQDVLTRGVNITIAGDEDDESSYTTVAEDTGLKCSCGYTHFYFEKVGQAHCEKCHAKFNYSEELNTYMPEFSCDNCGCNKVISDGMIAACVECCTAYLEMKGGGYKLL